MKSLWLFNAVLLGVGLTVIALTGLVTVNNVKDQAATIRSLEQKLDMMGDIARREAIKIQYFPHVLKNEEERVLWESLSINVDYGSREVIVLYNTAEDEKMGTSTRMTINLEGKMLKRFKSGPM